MKPSDVTYRFEDKSCGREQCSRPASPIHGNKVTGWFYCTHCTFRMTQFETDLGSIFFTTDEMRTLQTTEVDHA